jgi:phosphoglycolate phosphatase
MAIDRLGCAPAEAVYVGDSVVDAETARNAGTRFVAVLTGTTDRGSFLAYPVVAVLDRLSDLTDLLHTHATREA